MLAVEVHGPPGEQAGEHRQRLVEVPSAPARPLAERLELEGHAEPHAEDRPSAGEVVE
ncbi:MAG TPA: hypothetical protein VJT79_05000 [Pseudonocardia sp.]|nr:hypothetical protein [Pseudonocardia sp.]